MTPPDQPVGPEQQDAATFIEIKTGPYYSRMPFSEAGREAIKNFLNSLVFEGAETSKQKKGEK